jgi:EAL domain-containing protein (putative c-di-GMP-specific phosphodiesterase class I)
LRTACAQAVRWLRAGRPTRIAVNISALQWKDPRLLETVFETLSEVGLPSELLELELTESAVMMDVEGNLSKLHALRERGVRIALDDFGTGYSSLSYLSRMPLTSVKVDRSFVAGLAGLDHNRAIVRAVLAMARSLDLSVAAEGVETVDQAMILQAMACDVLQGFLFSPPVAASEIPALLKKRWPQLPATSPTAAPSAVRSLAGGRSLHSV